MDRACPPGDMSPECTEHQGLPAVARCVSCGRLLCAMCRVLQWNRNYCRACAASSAAGIAAAPQPHHSPQHYSPQQYGPPPYPPPPSSYPYPPAVRYPRAPAREPVFPGAPWGVGEAFIIFFASIAVAGTFSLVLAQAMASDSSSIQSRIIYIFLTSVILYAFLLAGTFYSVVARHHSTPSALGLKLAGLGKGFAWGLGLGMPLFVGALGLAYLSQQITGPSNPTNLSRSMNQLATSGVGAAFVFLLVFTLVVLAPVCEEIFFRGYLYPALRNRMNMQPAMLLNGILFAAAHFEIVGFLPRMFLGYGLCYMYEKNHNLSASMLGHALYNGLLIVLFGVFNIF